MLKDAPATNICWKSFILPHTKVAQRFFGYLYCIERNKKGKEYKLQSDVTFYTAITIILKIVQIISLIVDNLAIFFPLSMMMQLLLLIF